MFEARQRKTLILVGILVVLAAVAIIVNVRSALHGHITPVVSKTSDFLVTWRCLACGHDAGVERAGPGPKRCPKCDKDELYASFQFACAKHGNVAVAFNYETNGQPKLIKVADKAWLPPIDEAGKRSNLVCPSCGGAMICVDTVRRADEGPDTADDANQ